jgi:hypothetical protein
MWEAKELIFTPHLYSTVQQEYESCIQLNLMFNLDVITVELLQQMQVTFYLVTDYEINIQIIFRNFLLLRVSSMTM